MLDRDLSQRSAAGEQSEAVLPLTRIKRCTLYRYTGERTTETEQETEGLNMKAENPSSWTQEIQSIALTH